MNKQGPAHEEFIPVLITNKPRPPRLTNPHSEWRKVMESMQPGDWFEVPSRFKARVTCAGVKYLKGRHTCYRHARKANIYIFARTK